MLLGTLRPLTITLPLGDYDESSRAAPISELVLCSEEATGGACKHRHN